jgi:hypothetical protein
MGEVTLERLAKDSVELNAKIGISASSTDGDIEFHVRIQGDDWLVSRKHKHLEVAYIEAASSAQALLKRKDAGKS